jgi:hypothetical protein
MDIVGIPKAGQEKSKGLMVDGILLKHGGYAYQM